jgi:hypothetical protein
MQFYEEGKRMKKIGVVLAVVVFVVSMVSFAFAAGTQKGTIKSVDAKNGTVVFCEEGTNKDMTLKADKSVDLGKINAGEKVEVSIENDMLKNVMAAPAAKHRAPVGC